MQNPIITGMARALHVTAWADAEEDAGRTYPSQELCDVAPETPREAFDAAHNLCGRFEQANGMGIHALLWLAAAADDLGHEYPGDDYAESFGWYLAMQAMGHGVSWFDDHPEFEMEFPNCDYRYCGDEAYYG